MNRILQFTYIARPLVSEQCVNRLRSQFNVCIPEAGSVQLQKMFRQRQDVARTLAQGRKVDRRDIQPIIQILAKRPAATASPSLTLVAVISRTLMAIA